MPDYEKIGREVRAMFTGFPVEPETEEGRMVADLRYPGWREKGMPPAVPTPEAVEKWGRQWWMMHDPGNGDKDPVVADVCGGVQLWYTFGVGSAPVKDDGSWLGPVLERPVKP